MLQAALEQVWATYLKYGNLGTSLSCSTEPADTENIRNGDDTWSRKLGTTEWKQH